MATTDAVKRFDFSNSFDTNERGITESRDFTAADVEAVRAQAFADGKMAGAEEERQRVGSVVSAALRTLDQQLRALRGDFATMRSQVESDALDTVILIARKVVPHYAKCHGLAEIEGLVRECLSSLYEEPRIVVRVHDSVIDGIKEQIDALSAQSGFGGKVVLFSDQALLPQDCRVEWADGGAERDVARLWQDVDATISRFLGREPGVTASENAPGDTHTPK